MMVVDSNIIIYAINIDSPKHQKAKSFFVSSSDELVFFHQNIFESLRVLTHPKFPFPMKMNEAIKAVQSITQVGKILSPTLQTSNITMELLKTVQVSGNKVFDIYLIATMLSHDIETVATDNEKDFHMYKGITVYNPFRS